MKEQKLTVSDYDFSGIKSGTELQACGFYEYARESRAVRAEVAALRKQLKAKSGQLWCGPCVQLLHQSHILIMLSFCPAFPNTPWQCLSDRDKQIVFRRLASLPNVYRYSTTWHNPPLIFALNEPGTMTLDAWKKQCRRRLPTVPDNDPIMSGFFAVNMKYDHSVLIEEFSKYLRHFEGKPMLETPPIATKPFRAKPRGRKSTRDVLNALAIMRLRYHCNTFSEAQKLMQALKGKPHGMFYGYRDNANRACRLALGYFRKLFGWLDSSEPIHFSKNWGTQKTKCISEPLQK